MNFISMLVEKGLRLRNVHSFIFLLHQTILRGHYPQIFTLHYFMTFSELDTNQDQMHYQGNSFKDIGNKTVRRQEFRGLHPLFTHVLFSEFIRKQSGQELHFVIHNFFQKSFSEWKPYMANIVCKNCFCFKLKYLKKKILLKLVPKIVLHPTS